MPPTCSMAGSTSPAATPFPDIFQFLQSICSPSPPPMSSKQKRDLQSSTVDVDNSRDDDKAKRSKTMSFVNEFQSESSLKSIPTISLAEYSPDRFNKEFIAKRLPCIIDSYPFDDASTVGKLTSLEFLQSNAGNWQFDVLLC
jgi:hypothetical protein